MPKETSNNYKEAFPLVNLDGRPGGEMLGSIQCQQDLSLRPLGDYMCVLVTAEDLAWRRDADLQ